MQKLLLLGGTSEASRLAQILADHWEGARRQAVFSYAGRTARPVAQPLRSRVGGFGGLGGLVSYIRSEGITHVVDATHPFAAQMSRNAVAACTETQVPFVALERPAWRREDGDNWHSVEDAARAAAALPETPSRVFLAIGKQTIGAFAAAPQHHYLLRLVDASDGPPVLPEATVEVARGPFDLAGDIKLMSHHRITHLVAKNAGGSGAVAKVHAARALGLPVIMIERPRLPTRPSVATPEAVLEWLLAIHQTEGSLSKPGA